MERQSAREIDNARTAGHYKHEISIPAKPCRSITGQRDNLSAERRARGKFNETFRSAGKECWENIKHIYRTNIGGV